MIRSGDSPETLQQGQWTNQVAACRGGILIVLSRKWALPSMQGAIRYRDILHSVVGLHGVASWGSEWRGMGVPVHPCSPRVACEEAQTSLCRRNVSPHHLPLHFPRSRPSLTLHDLCCAYFLSRPLVLRGRGDGFVTVIAMGSPTKYAANGVATNPASGGTFLLAAGTSKVQTKFVLTGALFEHYTSRYGHVDVTINHFLPKYYRPKILFTKRFLS